jgi:PAS domain S-box-containing protein
MKTLLVEDERGSRMLIETVLRRRGYDPVSCRDAETAWPLCGEESFELVVLDWMLPGMNGLDLCRKIRTLDWGDRCAILVVTSRTAAGDLQEILTAGADDYLSKPIDPELLDVRLTIAEHSLELLRERKQAEEALRQAHSKLEERVAERTAELAQVNQGLLAEIAERKRMQTALQQSEQDYRTIFDNAYDAIIISSADDQTVLDVNHRGCEIYGYEREQLIGRQLAEITGGATTAVADRAAGLGDEVTHFRKDGTTLAIDTSSTPIQYKGRPAVLSVNRDITQRRALEQRLRQAQKMESLGQLAGTIAHDFNNIITAILTTTELAKRRIDQSHQLYDDLTLIDRASQSAAHLTRSLLAFARQRMLQPLHLDLNSLLADMLPVLQRLLPSNVTLDYRPANELGTIKGDQGQLEQVMMNLVSNARDALPAGGTITVATGNQTLDDAYVERYPWAYTGSFVYVAVSDDGTGMDQEVQSHIFDAYYTTKELGKGTGLGLASVYGSVKQHKGLIEVVSTPGEGSTFKILLPEEKTEATTVAAAEEAPVVGGNETVLVVEDYDDLREVVVDFVNSLGYQAVPASDGSEAYALLEEQKDRFQVVVTDIVMPGMSGPELYQRSRQLAPHLGFVFCTGNAKESGGFFESSAEKIICLEKPFSIDSLARKIREALDGPGG